MEPLLYWINSFRAERFLEGSVKEDFNLLSTDKYLYCNNWVRKKKNVLVLFWIASPTHKLIEIA